MSRSTSPITQRVYSLSGSDSRGKHRLQAELKRLEQETRLLEKKLDFLAGVGFMGPWLFNATRMLSYVKTMPDPLLSEATALLNPIWDRWFERPQHSEGCRCWFLW